MILNDCFACTKYYNCRRRKRYMRKIHRNHRTGSRQDFRARLYALRVLWHGCDQREDVKL